MPTPGMLLPLGNYFWVDANGRCGVGTSSPTTRLQVEAGTLPGVLSSTDGTDVSAITGWAKATSGSGAFGVYGESDGDAGTGVLGWAADQTGGTTWGVYGQADSENGTGTFGWATSVTGFNAGVSGRSDSTDGVGVVGLASTATGATVGVSGLNDSDNGTGVLGWARSASGSTSGVRGASDADAGAGVEGFATETTGANYGVYGETASSTGYGVFSAGDMGATGVKSFIQPHPSDPTKEIRFVCLEGNESGTYFRGSGQIVNGRATIQVPESFALVTAEQGITIQLTASGGRAVLWTEGESLKLIQVRADADVRFHYTVNGVRRGFEDFEPIRANQAFRPTAQGQAFGTQYPRGLRKILIDNGILNADGTPNEVTAARLGWELKPFAGSQTPEATSAAAAKLGRPTSR